MTTANSNVRKPGFSLIFIDHRQSAYIVSGRYNEENLFKIMKHFIFLWKIDTKNSHRRLPVNNEN